MVDCVSKQMQAFKEGFEQFFPISSLKMFYPSEVSVAYVIPCTDIEIVCLKPISC